jgi:hypothetical protein
MSEKLTENLPEVLKAIHTKHLFTMRAEVRPIVVIGAAPGGFRRAGIVPGGVFEGERLSGTVIEGGNDWQILRSDNSVLLDVRLNLKTDDGDLICMTYKGLRTGDAEILKRIDLGESVDPSTYYFRINPIFETASEKYGWLNNFLAIGTGYRSADAVIYNIFEIL